MRVLLDTNVLVSAFIAPGRCAELDARYVEMHRLLVSERTGVRRDNGFDTHHRGGQNGAGNKEPSNEAPANVPGDH